MGLKIKAALNIIGLFLIIVGILSATFLEDLTQKFFLTMANMFLGIALIFVAANLALTRKEILGKILKIFTEHMSTINFFVVGILIVYLGLGLMAGEIVFKEGFLEKNPTYALGLGILSIGLIFVFEAYREIPAGLKK